MNANRMVKETLVRNLLRFTARFMRSSHIPTSPSGFRERAPKEGRHHDRYPGYFNITLTDHMEGKPPVTAFIANISQGGVGVMTPVALRHGQVVNLQIGHSFLSGEVVYSIADGDYFRTGVRVLLPASGATSISDLLRTMLIEQRDVDPGGAGEAGGCH